MDRYLPADCFGLRTPLLPFEVVAALGTEPTEVRRKLAQLLSHATVRESIFLASPSLERTERRPYDSLSRLDPRRLRRVDCG